MSLGRRAAATVVAAAVAIVGAGCGVPDDAAVVRIADPAAAAGPAITSPTTSTPPAPTPGSAAVSVYFVRGSSLVASARSVDGRVSMGTLLRLLEAGPTAAEARRGLRTAVPDGVEATAGATGPVAVELGPMFEQLSGRDQLLALGQLALSLGGDRKVRFLLDGKPASVPAPDGSLTDQPVPAELYLALVE